mmetsp:Transcript_9436/g.28394  ORF Transcript_9436/g.28394 Transcript_9436/m.28394 type:complete len:294 (+) Transcript_9436:279-1160(+)
MASLMPLHSSGAVSTFVRNGVLSSLRRPAASAPQRRVHAAAKRKGRGGSGGGSGGGGGAAKGGRGPGLIELDPDGSDMWRLDVVADCLRQGGVGILTTDTFPAFVCDLENRDAVQKLYQLKGLSPTQPLSILCASFSDISDYTQGWQAANIPGQPDMFRLARQVLPGAYTFIMAAGKKLPKQMVDYLNGKSKVRRTVGVRMPADTICQAVLAQLDRPLLCSSIRAADQMSGELPEPVSLFDQFQPKGLDFVVDDGRRYAEGSTVVDMTASPPAVLRLGLGDATIFENMALASV